MSKSKAPLVRSTAWTSAIPHLLVVVGLVGLARGALGMSWASSLYLGVGLSLAYSLGSRAILTRHHKRGIRLTKEGKYAEAIPHFERSHDFFDRHRWLDAWRHVAMLSSSKFMYREMALVNIAFCYSQIGEGQQALEYYHRALREYPENVLAQAAINMAESMRGAAAP